MQVSEITLFIHGLSMLVFLTLPKKDTKSNLNTHLNFVFFQVEERWIITVVLDRIFLMLMLAVYLITTIVLISKIPKG